MKLAPLILVLALAAPASAGIALKGAAWPVGSTVRVRFLDGTPAQRRQVMDAFAAWKSHANLTIVESTDRAAEVRVSFAGQVAWSVIGTHARKAAPDQPTMNFAAIDRRIAIHETGHALGLVHEHQSPGCPIAFTEAVYAEYARQFGWSRASVDAEVLARYAAADVIAGAWDAESVMSYPFSPSSNRAGKPYPMREALSVGDKAFIRTLYPFPSAP